MRSTSSTRFATSAASDFGFFFPIGVGLHEVIDPGRVPLVKFAVAEDGQLLAVLVGPQVGAALEPRLSTCPPSVAFDAARRYAQKKAPAWLRKWIGGLDVEPSFPTPRLSECSGGRQRCTSLRRAHRHSRRTPRGLSDRDAACLREASGTFRTGKTDHNLSHRSGLRDERLQAFQGQCMHARPKNRRRFGARRQRSATLPDSPNLPLVPSRRPERLPPLPASDH